MVTKRLHTKICGITTVKDAVHAARCGADFVGLICAASPRQIDLSRAEQVLAALPATTNSVLLYRDANVAEIIAEVQQTACRWVQLHGCETIDDLRALVAECPGLHLIKAWEISAADDAEQIATYVAAACAEKLPLDVVILDQPKGGPHPGYDVLGEVSRALEGSGVAIWCAGGLTPENVRGALAAGVYQGTDVASGVESAPGIKDPAAVQAFISSVAHAAGHV